MTQTPIIIHRAGSHAHGTARETSDTDYCVVLTTDDPLYRGTSGDLRSYELSHFIELCVQGDIDATESLWVDEDHILYRTDTYDTLREHRLDFLSQAVARSAIELAKNQLSAINRTMKLSKCRLSVVPPQQDHFNSSDEYNSAMREYSQYWGWRRNRSPVRAALQEKHGYDTKHAMNIVRCLRIGVESLRERKVYVTRHDAMELLAIRDGIWTYDQLVKYIQDTIDDINYWLKVTQLSVTPDSKFIYQVLFQPRV